MDTEYNQIKRLGNVYNTYNGGGGFAGNVYDINYICTTFLTCPGGDIPMILVIKNGRNKNNSIRKSV